MTHLDLLKPVKFKNPTPDEEGLVFLVTNYNEVTNRCYIEVQNLPNWGESLKPQQLVSADDLINVDE
jgi:hypothetical protein